MKKTLLMISMNLCAAFTFGQITDPAPYCLYQPQFHYNMWEYIKIGSKTQQFGEIGSVSKPSNYQYYKGTTFESVAAGGTLSIEVKPYSVNDGEPVYFALFIDFNKNNTFEASEIVMQNANTINAALPTFGQPAMPITKTITLPASLTAGTYRMRLVRDGLGGFNYDSKYVINPCVAKTTFGYGSAYDFDMEVTAPATGLAANMVTTPEFTLTNTITSDYLGIQSAGNLHHYHYTIYSINGQVVQTQTLTNELNVMALERGLYFMTITNEENRQVYTARFIKQ